MRSPIFVGYLVKADTVNFLLLMRNSFQYWGSAVFLPLLRLDFNWTSSTNEWERERETLLSRKWSKRWEEEGGGKSQTGDAVAHPLTWMAILFHCHHHAPKHLLWCTYVLWEQKIANFTKLGIPSVISSHTQWSEVECTGCDSTYTYTRARTENSQGGKKVRAN